MVRQRILLSGNFKEKREKQSGVGYDLDFDATPLTPVDYRFGVVNLTTQDINQLVELAYKEAELICKDLLKISIPRLNINNPVQLVKTGARDSAEDSSDEEDKDKHNRDSALCSA